MARPSLAAAFAVAVALGTAPALPDGEIEARQRRWFGCQTYRSGDRSRSNWWVALLSYGAIRLFKALGLVREVHVPSPEGRRALAMPMGRIWR